MYNAIGLSNRSMKGQIHITQAENGFIIQIKFPFKPLPQRQVLQVIPETLEASDNPNHFDDFEFERPNPKVFVAKDYTEMFKILTENKLEDFDKPIEPKK